MQELDYNTLLETIIAKDPRYHRDAYLFLREALDHTQKKVSHKDKKPVRHVTGQELLEGIREYGLAQFGPMTLTVFEAWGVRRGEDFGELVFNLVESGLLSKTEQDNRQDFVGGYGFIEAFRRPFLPENKLTPSPPGPKSKPS